MTFHLESTSIFKLWRWTTVIIECDLLFCRKPGWCLLFCGCFFQIVNYNIKYKIFSKYLKCLYLYMVVFQVETKSPFLLNLHADVVVERSVMYIMYCRTLTGSLGRQFRLYKSCFLKKKTTILSAPLRLRRLCFWQVGAEDKNTPTLKPAGKTRNLRSISGARTHHCIWLSAFSVFQCTLFLWRSFALRHKTSQKHWHRSGGIRFESSRETASLLHPHLSSHSLHLINALTWKSSGVLPEIHQPLPYLPLLSFLSVLFLFLRLSVSFVASSVRSLPRLLLWALSSWRLFSVN